MTIHEVWLLVNYKRNGGKPIAEATPAMDRSSFQALLELDAKRSAANVK